MTDTIDTRADATGNAARNAARRPGGGLEPFSVLVVCTGNICRSPMGEHVLRHAFEQAGLGDGVIVASAGTGDWHIGQGANPPAERILAAAGYPTDHAAQQVTPEMVAASDLVLAADRGHLRALRRMADRAGSDPARIRLIREFDPAADGDEVPDPYGYPDEEFENVLAMLEAAAPGVVDEVRSVLT